MNQLERLRSCVQERVPDATLAVDEPLDRGAPWMLDAALRDRTVNVEWRRYHGFGISLHEGHGYGEGPDEVVPDLGAAVDRVVQLLTTDTDTVVPPRLSLAQLRRRAQLGQADLAKRLKVSQAVLSRIEKNPVRSRLATLRAIVHGLGAQLEVRAILSDDRAFTLELGDPPPRRRSPESGADDRPRGRVGRRRRSGGGR